MTRACVHCVHCVKANRRDPVCNRTRVELPPHPVSGEPMATAIECRDERQTKRDGWLVGRRKCGPDGLYFEQRQA